MNALPQVLARPPGTQTEPKFLCKSAAARYREQGFPAVPTQLLQDWRGRNTASATDDLTALPAVLRGVPNQAGFGKTLPHALDTKPPAADPSGEEQQYNDQPVPTTRPQGSK